MSVEGPFSELPPNESGGTVRTPCPLHGCKRVYSDRSALEAHVKDHDSPAQSLPGKVLLCSTVGCSSSFPNMKKLMEHMRHHHKPNIYFLCESCRTKLRSYRGLLTHLHTCSKVPRGKPKVAETVAPLINAGSSPNPTPAATNQNAPQLDSMSKSQEMDFQTADSDSSVPQPNRDALPPLALTDASNLDIRPEEQELKMVDSDALPHVGSAATVEGPDAEDQLRPPKSPSSSSIIWKKNQGMTYSRRILWEHTKGRYMCVQCGHSVTTRAQMSQHISSHHRTATEDAGSSAPNT